MEGALRNLHLDCTFDGDEEPCASRILHFDRAAERMLIAQPARQGRTLRKIAPGVSVTCSCRLGREILRFSAAVAGREMFQLNGTARTPALKLNRVTPPRLIQRRRHFRVSMARHPGAEVLLWALRAGSEGIEVLEQFRGKMVDLSAGGASVLLEEGKRLGELRQERLWSKIVLPGENENLIFRVEARHIKYVKASQMYHVGLEFTEFIDPGRHGATVEKLVRYVAMQERDELKRLSQRRV